MRILVTILQPFLLQLDLLQEITKGPRGKTFENCQTTKIHL